MKRPFRGTPGSSGCGVTSSMSSKSKYRTGTGQDAGPQRTVGHATTIGQDYEVALCCLVFLRALRLASDFFILSNYAPAGKFDDVVLFYRLRGDDDGNKPHRVVLVQAKHRETPTAKRLTAYSPFSLGMYLDSFANIKRLWEDSVNVEGREVEVAEVTLVLYSNTGCSFDGVARDVSDCADVKDLRDFVGTGRGRLLKISDPRRLKLPQDSDFFGRLVLCIEQISVDEADDYLDRELSDVLALTSPSVADRLRRKLKEGVKRWWSARGPCRRLTAESEEWTDVLETQVARLNADSCPPVDLGFTDAALAAVRPVRKLTWIAVADQHQVSATRVRMLRALGTSGLVPEARLLLTGEVAALWGTAVCPSLVADLTGSSPSEESSELLLERLLTDVHDGRRLVVISRRKPPPDDARWSLYEAEATWSVLDAATRDRLLSVEVDLQGRAVPLRDVVVVGQNASGVMSDQLISALCNSAAGPLRLGSPPESSSSLDTYVPQCLQRTAAGEISLDALPNGRRLIFSNSFFPSTQLNNPKIDVLHKSVLERTNHIIRTTLVRGIREDSTIRRECCRLGVRGLSEDVGLERKLTEFVPFTWLCPDKVVVIEGVAGVGKSTFASAMCSRFKEQFPDSWVLRFDLAKHTGFIKGRDFSDASDVTAFLLRSLPKEQQRLQQDLLEHCLYVTGNVFIFFDAFDEISPKYTAQFCRLLKAVASEVSFLQMVVTTRRINVKEVEEALGTKAFSLPVFSEDEQNFFLERFCKAKGMMVDGSKVSSLRQAAGPILDTPLLCRMAAEMLLHPDDRNLLGYKNPWCKVLLYRRFVEQTLIDRPAEKLDLPISVLGEALLESQSSEHLRNLQALAVRKLMPIDQLCNIDIPTKLPEEKLGLVVSDGDGSVDLQHRTFAEYFLGCWLAQHWQRCPRELLRELLSQEGFEFVLTTLSWSLFEDLPLHVAVARGDGDEVHLTSSGATEEDRGGRSALHVAAMTQGGRPPVYADADLWKCDKVLGESAVRYAEMFRNWRFLELLIGKGTALEDLKFLTDQEAAKRVLNEVVKEDLTGLFQLIYRLHQEIFYLAITDEGDTLLHNAAANNSTQVLELLISQRRDVNVVNCHGVTPLHSSAEYGNVEALTLLLENGADPNSTNENGRTALMLAAAQGHLGVVKELLLRRGADLNVRDKDGYTALKLAAVRGHVGVVKILLENGVDPNTKTKTDYTALMLAAFQGFLETVKVLLENGADVNARDEHGATALMFASGVGHLEVVNVLLEKGADLNIQNDNGDTALMLGAIHGPLEVANVLLRIGTDLSIKNKDGYTAFMKAAGRGCTEIVNLLLEKGVEPNEQIENGDTALFVAAGRGHLEVVRVLLEKGVDVNIKNKDGETALMLAAAQGHLDVVKLLLEEGADVNAKNKDRVTALILAVTGGYLEVVKLLLENKADLNIKGPSGITALMLAASQSRPEIAKVLLEKGADPNVQSDNGDTALIIAAVKGDVEAVKLLSESETDLNIKNKGGFTALSFAAGQGHLEIVRILLDKGTDPNIQNEFSDTALMLSADQGFLEVVNVLLEKGADLNVKDKDGNTAFIRAANLGHLETVRLLLEKGVDPNTQNEHGHTVLMVAAGRGDLEMLKVLLEIGADPDIKDKDGDTALIIAATFGQMEVVNLLLEKGADPNIQNEHGNTVLMVAASGGHLEVLKELLEVGADPDIKDKDGDTALTIALNGGHPEVVKVLSEKVTLQDSIGDSSL